MDRSVWDQLDLSVLGIVCHVAAGIWDRVTQGTGLLVEEGLVEETMWGSRKCNAQQPQGYPGNRSNVPDDDQIAGFKYWFAFIHMSICHMYTPSLKSRINDYKMTPILY